MPTYKLYYFPIRGRAELARLVFAAAGQSYQNETVNFAEWPALKPKMPTGQMPMLEVDGIKISQSLTIARFLAREHGLAGESSLEQAMVDQVVETIADLMTQYIKYYFEKDEPKKEEIKNQLMNNVFPKVATILVTFLGENEFFVGSKLTLADLSVYEGMENFVRSHPEMLSSFPTLARHRIRVESDQNVKKYLESRPQTDI